MLRLGALEVKLNALLGNYDKLKDRPTDQRSDQWTSAQIGALETKLNALLGNYDRLMDQPTDQWKRNKCSDRSVGSET